MKLNTKSVFSLIISTIVVILQSVGFSEEITGLNEITTGLVSLLVGVSALSVKGKSVVNSKDAADTQNEATKESEGIIEQEDKPAEKIV